MIWHLICYQLIKTLKILVISGDKMDKNDKNIDALSLLESDEFDTLLDAVELMAKAQGNLLSLQRSVEELKVIMEETEAAQDELNDYDNAVIYNTIDNIQELVDNLVEDFSLGKI